jgi:hypothetical protein
MPALQWGSFPCLTGGGDGWHERQHLPALLLALECATALFFGFAQPFTFFGVLFSWTYLRFFQKVLLTTTNAHIWGGARSASPDRLSPSPRIWVRVRACAEGLHGGGPQRRVRVLHPAARADAVRAALPPPPRPPWRPPIIAPSPPALIIAGVAAVVTGGDGDGGGVRIRAGALSRPWRARCGRCWSCSGAAPRTPAPWPGSHPTWRRCALASRAACAGPRACAYPRPTADVWWWHGVRACREIPCSGHRWRSPRPAPSIRRGGGIHSSPPSRCCCGVLCSPPVAAVSLSLRRHRALAMQAIDERMAQREQPEAGSAQHDRTRPQPLAPAHEDS